MCPKPMAAEPKAEDPKRPDRRAAGLKAAGRKGPDPTTAVRGEIVPAGDSAALRTSVRSSVISAVAGRRERQDDHE